MKPRDIFLLVGLIAAAAAVVVLATGGGSGTVDSPTGPGPGTPVAPGGAAAELPTVASQGVEARSSGDPTQPERRVGPAPDGATTGIIDGRVFLAGGLPSAITGFTILFDEAINPNVPARPDHTPRSWTRGFRADPGVSPLYFTETKVPFSEYGYRVTVFVPSVNGSEQFVRCDSSAPVGEVSLSITPGGPYSLRLMDQYRNPLVGRQVTLRPKGWPQGRAVEERVSDSFGVSVYESLLAGVWDVAVDGDVHGEITVQPPGVVNDGAAVGVQSAVLTIPVGKPLKIEAFNAANWGLQDVDLTLIKVDTTENRRLTAKTDVTGCYVFPSVTPGRWQLTASGGGNYFPTSRTVEIAADRDPDPVRVRLMHVR